MGDVDYSLLGVGLYSVPQAARLTGISDRRIRGWIAGYSGRHREPLIRRQWEPIEGRWALGFMDLMEVRFIGRFAEWGVSHKALRMAAQNARFAIDHAHPFATANLRYRTDRKTLFLETQRETGDRKLLDLVKNQFALYEVVEESLLDDVIYNDLGDPLVWYPRRAEVPDVVINPHISFGRPVLERSHIPTEALYRAFDIEGSYEEVARWYDISPQEVKEAVRFEVELAA